MEEKNSKHSIFNVFDLVVIAVALVLGAVLAISTFVSRGGNAPTDRPAQGGSARVTYIVEFIVEDEERDMISVGDRVVDKIQHYNLGVVENIEYTEAVRGVVDYEREEIVNAPIPGYTALTVTITADAGVYETGILVDGGYPLRLGTSVNAVFPRINKAGTVIMIERGQTK